MPHKRNPVLSENLTGLARYIRSAVIPSMENIVNGMREILVIQVLKGF